MEQQKWQFIESILDKALRYQSLDDQKDCIIKLCEKDRQLAEEIIELLLAIHKARESNFLGK